MPNLYHSDIHMPRWKRVGLWLFESRIGRLIYFSTGFAIGFGPVLLWHWWWWMGFWMVAILSFAIGWNAARKSFLRNGFLDKI